MRTLKFFKKISDYFWKLTSEDGSLVCPKHRIEHTGKNVYSVIIDLKLYQLTNEEKYFERAKLRVQRTIKKLIRDPEFGYWIFYPGRLGRWNMANSVIDAGACLDALATFYLAYHDRLDEREKRGIEEAILKNGDTYLTKVGVAKEVTNQRLWGGTGLSRAYQIFKKENWRKSLVNSIERSLNEMWPDGTFPYHSYWQKFKTSKGVYDTTAYYHSRCIAFCYYILENLEEDLDRYKEKLIKATDVLVAMYQPNGVKNINLECKRWYWSSTYEIASNSFDVYTLTKSYGLTGNKIYLYYAKKAFGQIIKHILRDGGITSHLREPQNNFQCRIFWNAHLAWLSRVAEELFSLQVGEETEGLRYFEQSGILKFKNENYSCILRGKKQAMSLMWGPAIGGGSLLYFGSRKNNWENIFRLKPWQENVPGNFSFYIKENYFRNLKRFIIENKKEIRSKLYHVIVELHTPNPRSTLALMLNLFKMIVSAAKGIYASQWATDPVVQKQENKIIFEIVPTKRNGKSLDKVKIKREYVFKNDEICVKENLFIKNEKIERVKYNKIPDSVNFKIITDLKFKETNQDILFHHPEPKSHLEISYSLKYGT